MQSRQPYIHTYRHKRTYSTPTERHLAFLVQWGRRHQSLFILSCLPFCPSTCLPAYLTVTQMPVCPSAPPLSLSFSLPSAFVSLLLYLSMAPESHILVRPVYSFLSRPLSLSLHLSICVSPSPILCLSACVMMNLNPMPYSSVHSIPSHSHCLGVSNSLPTSASLSLLWPALYLSVSLCLSASLSRWRSLHIIDLSSALISSSAISNEHFPAHSVTSTNIPSPSFSHPTNAPVYGGLGRFHVQTPTQMNPFLL